MAIEACYWFIGTKNFSQPMGVAVDLHDDDGELIGETRTLEPVASRVHAIELVEHYCKARGIPWSRIFYDDDSTQCFETC